MVFLKFYASTVNIYYGSFMLYKIIYVGLEFYNAMMRNFLFSNVDVEK